jgi:hypothetical protein
VRITYFELISSKLTCGDAREYPIPTLGCQLIRRTCVEQAAGMVHQRVRRTLYKMVLRALYRKAARAPPLSDLPIARQPRLSAPQPDLQAGRQQQRVENGQEFIKPEHTRVSEDDGATS